MTLDNINVDPEKIRLLCEPPEAEVPKEEEKPVEKPSGRQKGGKYPEKKDAKPQEPTKKEKKKLE